jgi:hypothetical protein
VFLEYGGRQDTHQQEPVFVIIGWRCMLIVGREDQRRDDQHRMEVIVSCFALPSSSSSYGMSGGKWIVAWDVLMLLPCPLNSVISSHNHNHHHLQGLHSVLCSLLSTAAIANVSIQQAVPC